MKNIQQRHRPRASPCQCAWWSPATTRRLTGGRAEVLIACPKCGETRLIEQLDGHHWFCAVCAHSWTIAANAAMSPDLRRLIDRVILLGCSRGSSVSSSQSRRGQTR
jgi:uncharacterized protein (DUF983 family)